MLFPEHFKAPKHIFSVLRSSYRTIKTKAFIAILTVSSWAAAFMSGSSPTSINRTNITGLSIPYTLSRNKIMAALWSGTKHADRLGSRMLEEPSANERRWNEWLAIKQRISSTRLETMWLTRRETKTQRLDSTRNSFQRMLKTHEE